MTSLIQPIAEGSAGEVNGIAVQAFNDSEVLTALVNGSGNLELISWHTDPALNVVTRGADSGTQAGTANEVALAIIGRTAITAVQSGSNKLLLISWNVSSGLNSVTRLHDTGSAAGAASNIAITTVGTDLVVTAVRNGSGNLELISWRLESDQTLSRLNDSGSQAGEVSWVTIAAIDSGNVVTAVRNGSGNLELIGWSVGTDGSLNRWGDSGGQAGAVSEIALTAVPSGSSTSDVVTAVVDGSGNLLLITWRPSPAAGTFSRLADCGAGTASDIAVCPASTNSGPKYVASMRRGAGNLELIAFDPIGNGTVNAVVRTGDYENADDTDVTETVFVNLDPGRILGAMRINNNLAVATYTVSDAATTLIQPIAEGSAGEVNGIAVQAFNDSEVLTALVNGSGNLELISWHTDPALTVVTRGADSGSQAGTAHEVALAIIGRTAITAVQSGSNKLLLISWNVPSGLGSVTRLHDTGSAAGAASNIAITAVGTDIVVTAVRNGSGNLELISWRLESDQTLSRLNDSGSQAGTVSWVTIAAIDSGNVVTAVCNGSGNLELIGWSVGTDGSMNRWGDSGSQAGAVSEIALTAVPSGSSTSDVVTAVEDGSGNLLLITWRPSPAAGTFTRVTDSGDAAGTASDIAVCSTMTASGPKTMASMSNGSSAFELIAFQEIAGATTTSLVRTGDYTGEPNNSVSLTVLASLDPGRVVSAVRISLKCQSPSNQLLVTIYGISDPPQPTPSNILGIQFSNPALPTGIAWPASDGQFPYDDPKEWVQVLAPSDDYEEASLIGCTGWVIEPHYSGGDLPCDHPFGFDWEFEVALDKEFQALLSPANTAPQNSGLGPVLAKQDGLPMANGLLGVEWDKNLLPKSFVSNVNHGDRVAAFGRWILDTGHAFGPPSLIEPIAQSGAGEISWIAAQAFNDSEVLTAMVNGSGNLELISWHTDPALNVVTRGADSGSQAGTAYEVALAIIGRTAITAVQSGSNRLLLISWNVPSGLSSVTRLHDTGTAAGAASNIAITAVGTDLVVTAVRNGSGNLELISWRLESDQSLSRLNDSGSQAGEVSWVTIAPIDSGNVVTAVRNGSGNLELIGWSVGTDGSLNRWGDSGSQAGAVSEIAITAVPSGTSTSDIVTTVVGGARNLIVITWRPSPAAGTFTRMGDWAKWATGAGEPIASDIAVCATSTDTGPKYVTSMRGDLTTSNGTPSGVSYLELIAFDPVGIGTVNSVAQTGAYTDVNDTNVSQTTLVNLDPGRVLGAMYINNDLVVTTYRIGDTATSWRTEIHPPLLLATANVEQDAGNSPFSRALFMSRPFLSGQTYTVDVNNIYDDSAPDDGPFITHLVNELFKVITFRSVMVETHPKIKSFPFKGSYSLQIIVSPPAKPPKGKYELVVSFQFTMRNGCQVAVTKGAGNSVAVTVTLDSGKYTPPPLPIRRNCVYSADELNSLAKGIGTDLIVGETLAPLVAALVSLPLAFIVAYVDIILARGLKLDAYEPIPEVNILDASQAVLNAPVSNIPSGQGMVVDNTQPYPVYGWLDVKWIPANAIQVKR
jgi:hypothetical protein